MAFLYPTFLLALAAITIPIIIHLFNFRRYKTIYFSNTRFLQEVKEKTDSRSRLKHLLVLLCRILAITFLVFAFAQPYVKQPKTPEAAGRKTISIYLDNSFSMGQTAADVPLLEHSKAAAAELVAASGDGDLFQLLTSDFEGRHQRLVDKQEMLNLVKEVKITPTSRSVSEVFPRQQDALKGGSGLPVAYLLSDFQRNFSDFTRANPDTSIRWNLVPVKSAEAANVYIDTCFFESPVQIKGQEAGLVVQVFNRSGKAISNGRITLKVNGQIKAISDFVAEANGYAADTIAFTIAETGWNKAELSIVDHPVTFDDTYYLSFPVAEMLNVTSIHENTENAYLKALFSGNVLFRYKALSSGQINYAELLDQQFIILDGLKSFSTGLTAQIRTFMEQGGNVCLFPAADADLGSYNAFLATLQADALTGFQPRPTQVSLLNMQDPVFKNVFQRLSQNVALPKAGASFGFSGRSSTGGRAVLTNSDGSLFLVSYETGNGFLYVSSVPLNKEYTDLALSPVFAPMMYNMAITRWQSSLNTFVIGRPAMAEVTAANTGADDVLRLRSVAEEFIPRQRLIGNTVQVYLDESIHDAGFFDLTDAGGQVKAVFAMNFDRRESDLTFLGEEELEETAQRFRWNVIGSGVNELSTVLAGQRSGIPLWKVSVILALIFIAIEIALLKLWK